MHTSVKPGVTHVLITDAGDALPLLSELPQGDKITGLFTLPHSESFSNALRHSGDKKIIPVSLAEHTQAGPPVGMPGAHTAGR